ncbi:MAG TPA: hypothetical protein VMD55_00955 [Terracidiphilus sp.]|nr:hypothetical protein [Terracidiphilus sp.]
MPAYFAKVAPLAKLLLELLLLLAVPVVFLLLMGWLHLGDLRINRGTARMIAGGRLEFSRARWAIVRWLWEIWFWGIGTIGLAIQIHRGHMGWPLLYLALFPVLFVHALVSFPGSIVMQTEGIEQVYWLRSNKKIRWMEISAIRRSDKGREITIVGTDGTEIVHSRRLADQPRFLRELRAHCRTDLLQDFQSGNGASSIARAAAE